jgi:hypothetical protein
MDSPHIAINVNVHALEMSSRGIQYDQYDQDDQHDQDDEDDGTFVVKCGTCPICQEEAVEPKVVLECGHTFDDECFKQFVTYELRNGKTIITCPFCRSCILEVEANVSRSISEQTQPPIQDVHRPPSVLRELLMSREGHYCIHFIIEAAIIGIVLFVVYVASCKGNRNCIFKS